VLLAIGVVVFVAGLFLPPGGKDFREAQTAWRAIGGASLCALVLFFTVLWAGLAQVTRSKEDGAIAELRDSPRNLPTHAR
jgi:hypothetical protein